MRSPFSHLRPKGFTLTELMISLIIIALVGGALVSLGEAVHKGWKATENQSNLEMSVNGASNQVQTLLRSSLWIGVVYSDSNVAASDVSTAHGVKAIDPGILSAGTGAACFFWTGESAIDKMYIKDMRVIEHDLINNTLVLWMIPPDAPNANTIFNSTDMSSPAKVVQFKNLPYAMKRTIATGVVQCKFTGWGVNSSTNIRTIEAMITFRIGDIERQWYGVISPPAIASSVDFLPAQAHVPENVILNLQNLKVNGNN